MRHGLRCPIAANVTSEQLAAFYAAWADGVVQTSVESLLEDYLQSHGGLEKAMRDSYAACPPEQWRNWMNGLESMDANDSYFYQKSGRFRIGTRV